MKFTFSNLFFLFLGVFLLAACNPFKVTDPSDPHFDPMKFSFRDNLFDREAKMDAFRKLFPIGTPKEFVDEVLIEAGGATSSQSKQLPRVWRYLEPQYFGFPKGPVHRFIFDENNKVDNIYYSVSEYLYSSRTTIEELRKQENLKAN